MVTRIPRAELFSVVEKRPTGFVAVEGTLPDVSVVTVVFNAIKSGRGREFVRCLDSVQAQCGCRIEHLIVDGGSRDGTVEAIADYVNVFVPMRYVTEPDHGIYEAMNRALALARGKYVVFLNSDDRFCSPDGMSASVKALEASGADYSYAPAHVVDADGNPVEHDFAEADESRTLFCGMTICHQTILIRRDVLLAVDGFDLAYRSASDYDLFLRIIYAGYKGVRVEENFVAFLSGGFSSVNATLAEHEVDCIFQSRFREVFGLEFSVEAVHRMRETLEYPVALSGRILSIGERSLNIRLRAFDYESSEWAADVRWWFRHSLPDAVWAYYDRLHLPWSWLRQVAHCLMFAGYHPLQALGAVKSWGYHLLKGYAPIDKWFLAWSALLVERQYETYRVVFPCDFDLVASPVKMWKSYRGLVVTDSIRISVAFGDGRRMKSLFVRLFAIAYQERERKAEILLNGCSLGVVVLSPTVAACWRCFRLPSALIAMENAEVEIQMQGNGEFVFGGLCFCPSL